MTRGGVCSSAEACCCFGCSPSISGSRLADAGGRRRAGTSRRSCDGFGLRWPNATSASTDSRAACVWPSAAKRSPAARWRGSRACSPNARGGRGTARRPRLLRTPDRPRRRTTRHGHPRLGAASPRRRSLPGPFRLGPESGDGTSGAGAGLAGGRGHDRTAASAPGLGRARRDPNASPLPYAFRYFQQFEEDIVLPPRFLPLRLIVRWSPEGGREAEESFAWEKLLQSS